MNEIIVITLEYCWENEFSWQYVEWLLNSATDDELIQEFGSLPVFDIEDETEIYSLPDALTLITRDDILVMLAEDAIAQAIPKKSSEVKK